MIVDRDRVTELRQKQQNGQAADSRVLLETLSQAQIKAEHVTGDPNWDTFLSYIQAAVESHEEELEQLKTMLESPVMVAPDDIMRLKIAIISCRARLAAWDAVISLPKDIKEHGEKARAILDRIDDAVEE